jgi:hypothetical protein
MALLNDKGMAQHFGANGLRRVHEKFTLARMVCMYEKLYEKALLKT